MATHSSILAWEIPWTEGPGGLWSMRLQRVKHDYWLNKKNKRTHPLLCASFSILLPWVISSSHMTLNVDIICVRQDSLLWATERNSSCCKQKASLFKVYWRAPRLLGTGRPGLRKEVGFWQQEPQWRASLRRVSSLGTTATAVTLTFEHNLHLRGICSSFKASGVRVW